MSHDLSGEAALVDPAGSAGGLGASTAEAVQSPNIVSILASRAALVVALGLTAVLVGDAPAPVNPYQRKVASSPDCPSELRCVVNLAALGPDGQCNYSPADRTPAGVLGITHHITEASLTDALRTFRDKEQCRSAHYVIGSDGTVFENVPPDNIAYTAGNSYTNLHYVQVELVGPRDACPALTEAQFKALAALDGYLIDRYNIKPSTSTLSGHDSVPSPNEARAGNMHTDPYNCWPWGRLWDALGVPKPNSEGADGSVVMIDPHLGENSQPGGNALPLYEEPSTEAPLATDPYIHPDGSPGSSDQHDWGDKARAGHMFVVAGHTPGWTGIYYGGRIAWFQDNGHVTVPVHAEVVTPRGNLPAAIYGKPSPDSNQTRLTQYAMQPGQEYVVMDVPTPNDAITDCADSSCTSGGEVVKGDEQYVGIFWNGRFAFVKAADVTLAPAGR